MFVNHLFCTELLYEKKILHKIKKIYVIQKEWYYFDLKKLYEACSFSFNVLTNVHIEAIEKKAKNREFYLNGVLLRKRIKPESIRRSFQRVADTAPLLIDDKFKSIHEEVQKYSPVIWMGITGQKRRWIEQEEGYANIISRLHKKYPNIAIIMDGWTTGKYDEAYCKSNVNIQKDMQVVENIKALIDDDIPLFNIVGRSSIEKISIGNLVDFFIANNGTGSMNIDTICMRPGITHISNRFRRSSELGNINYSQNLIAEEKVTDLETDSEFKHVGDYSINWEDIMAMVDTFIKQMDNGELITPATKELTTEELVKIKYKILHEGKDFIVNALKEGKSYSEIADIGTQHLSDIGIHTPSPVIEKDHENRKEMNFTVKDIEDFIKNEKGNV